MQTGLASGECSAGVQYAGSSNQRQGLKVMKLMYQATWRDHEYMGHAFTSIRYEEDWPGKACTSAMLPDAPP